MLGSRESENLAAVSSAQFYVAVNCTGSIREETELMIGDVKRRRKWKEDSKLEMKYFYIRQLSIVRGPPCQRSCPQ